MSNTVDNSKALALAQSGDRLLTKDEFHALADVPPENIIAMFKAADDVRGR